MAKLEKRSYQLNQKSLSPRVSDPTSFSLNDPKLGTISLKHPNVRERISRFRKNEKLSSPIQKTPQKPPVNTFKSKYHTDFRQWASQTPPKRQIPIFPKRKQKLDCLTTNMAEF